MTQEQPAAEIERLRQRVAELEADGRIACSFEGHTKDVALIMRLKSALREIMRLDTGSPTYAADVRSWGYKALAQAGGE